MDNNNLHWLDDCMFSEIFGEVENDFSVGIFISKDNESEYHLIDYRTNQTIEKKIINY